MLEVRLYSGEQRSLAGDWKVGLANGGRWGKVVLRQSRNIPLVATVAYVSSPGKLLASVGLATPVPPSSTKSKLSLSFLDAVWTTYCSTHLALAHPLCVRIPLQGGPRKR